MKSNIKIISIALFAILLGIGIGYLLFGKNQVVAPTMEHNHAAAESTLAAKEETYTCSMHPQIRQNEMGICPICEMDLTPLDANTSNDPLVLQMTEEAVKLANIETSVVGGGSGNRRTTPGKTIQLSGKVQADERLASSQVAHIPGRIEKLYVSFTGEQVRKGQKVADIYSPSLITAQRELLEALKLQDLSPGLVKAARNKLRFWKVGDATISAIEQKGTIQETFPLYADASGIVTNRRVAVGDHLKEGTPLFDLMNLEKVWVLFDAYEGDLANIKVGDQVEFTAASVPNKTFKTRITFIDPMLNAATRTASVRTEVSNRSGQLKPEMFVEGVVQQKASTTNTAKKADLTVPKSAVLWTGKRSVVYVKVPDSEIPSFQFREIELGTSVGNSYQVSKGLDAGEEVVTYGSFTIDAAAQLNNQASMMNKNVQIKKNKSDAVPNFQVDTPKQFKEQLNALANAYIQLKDALVETDAQTAATAAKQMVDTIQGMDGTVLKEEAYIYWMQQLDALESHTAKIANLQKVEAQRKQFNFVSDALINSIEAFGTVGGGLYVQYCPMAFNNTGADWIASEEEIQNPYFGDKMMRCGLVKKELLGDARIEMRE